MRYPMLSNWLLIQQNGQHNSFEIINELTEETFSTTEYGDEAYIEFITSLDGKTDYRSIGTYSPRVATAIINELHSFGLLRESRWLCRSLSFTAYSLIIPKHQSTNSILPRIINALLWTLFLPVLIYGLVCLSSVFNYLDEISIVGIICGYAFGIICHEAGHAVATLSEGGRVLEFGLQISNVFFLGAYTMLKTDRFLSPLKKIQVDACGIEANLFLAGVAFVLARYNPQYIDFLYCFGSTNLLLGVLNLCNINGNDGSNILSTLLGVDGSIVDLARASLFDPDSRSYLLGCGSTGRITLCAYCIVLFMQVATPALIIANLAYVFSALGG